MSEEQDGKVGPPLPQLLEQVHADHARHAQTADQEAALGEELAARQRLVIERHPVAVATERADDQVGRDGIVLGNDDAVPKEGGDIGRAHGKTLGPGTVREWQVGRKAMAEYTMVAIGGGDAAVTCVVCHTIRAAGSR